MRELGKSAFLQCIDVGRATARTVGRQLVADGTLAHEDDVFYLTVDELLQSPIPAEPATVQARRLERDRYRLIRLPEFFEGSPRPLQEEPAPARTATVQGMGVSPGIVEGTARVVLDPASATLEAGELLVAPVTDPAWTPLFLIAAGVVIDIGGPLSHGAIIARELGLPCVINTGTGTATIKTGDRIRLNGATGEVTVLS